MAAPHKVGKRTERRLSQIEEKLDRLLTVLEAIVNVQGELLEVKDNEPEENADTGKGKRKSKKDDPETAETDTE